MSKVHRARLSSSFKSINCNNIVIIPSQTECLIKVHRLWTSQILHAETNENNIVITAYNIDFGFFLLIDKLYDQSSLRKCIQQNYRNFTVYCVCLGTSKVTVPCDNIIKCVDNDVISKVKIFPVFALIKCKSRGL